MNWISDLSLLSASALAGLTCVLLIASTSNMAELLGLVDRPSGRKCHEGEVPIVGGLCIFFATVVSLAVVYPGVSMITPLLVGSGLVLLGVLDDRFGLSTLVRFPVQVTTALIMITVGQMSIENVGNLFGQGPVVLGAAFSVVFTVICTVGVINSINMIDGVDGLSGCIVAITLAPLAYFSYVAGDMQSVALLVTLISAIAAFLVFNSRLFRSRALIFMGDAGSTLLGFLLVWFFIKLTQGDSPVLSAVAAGWIFGLSLLDTVAVMLRRVCSGRSPFDADRTHLHHRLLDAGLSVNQVVLCMSLMQAGFVLTGLICNLSSPTYEPFFFWLFVTAVVIHFSLAQQPLSHWVPGVAPKLAGERSNGAD